MAIRLPIPGSDDGEWGDLLNTFLEVEHNGDGTLKRAGTISQAAADAATALSAANTATTTANNATATANSKYTKPAGGIPKADLSGSVQASLDTADARDAAKLQGTAIDGSAPSDGQVLVYAAGSNSWVPNTATSTMVSDATGSTKGIIQLGGDLAGSGSTADAPLISAGSVTNTKIAADTIVDANISAAAAIATSKISGLDATISGLNTAVSGKAAKGANSDITSLSGLTTPLSAAQGGTGNTSGKALVDVAKAGTTVGTRSKLNFIEGSNVTITTTDNSANGQVDVTIAAAGGGTGGSGYNFNFTSKSADYTASNNDFVFVTATPAAVTITLPTPVANGFVRVKRLAASGNSVQVVAPAGAVIDAAGVGSDTINNQYQSQDYLSDGTNWYRV